jgi:NAD(P)-dependent dehydrogenase (short-subunit alcohol dehydrogenase family)
MVLQSERKKGLPMGNILKDKVAVVTGSGRGLGKAFVGLMAQEGARVVVNDLGGDIDGKGASTTPADEVVSEIRGQGGEAVANYDSAATAEGGERIIKTAIDNFARIDILVNCAGITRDRMIFNMTDEEWDSVIRVHLYGHFYCTRAACAVMRQQRSGRIINISSIVALGNTGQANYGAAKAGILGLTRCVARDMARYGVTCNAILPHAATRLTLTDAVKAAAEEKKSMGIIDDVVRATDELKELTPEDNAPLVVFLASDAASNINGCTFLVKKGLLQLYGDPMPLRTIYKPDRWTVEELMDLMPKSLAYGLGKSAAQS